jgi:hypothetical protein
MQNTDNGLAFTLNRLYGKANLNYILRTRLRLKEKSRTSITNIKWSLWKPPPFSAGTKVYGEMLQHAINRT